MCDYSLVVFPNRLAERGEDLVTYKFPAGPLGFASLSDWRKVQKSRKDQPRPGLWLTLKQNLFNPPKPSRLPAVCIPPGACLLLQDIPVRTQRSMDVGPDEVVMLTGITTILSRRQDGLQFGNGRYLLLQEIGEGQRAKVLDLSIGESLAAYEEWLEES